MSLRCKACSQIDQPGCGCAARDNRRRRWQADVWSGAAGAKKRRHITSDPKTPAEARAWYRALLADAERGREDALPPATRTLREAVRRFLPEYVQDVKPTQYANVEANLRLYVLPEFGARPLHTIDVPTIDAYTRKLVAGMPRASLDARLLTFRENMIRQRFKGDLDARVAAERERILSKALSARSIRGIIVALGQVLGEAVRWGWIPSNPAKAVRWRIKGAARKRFALTQAELDALEALTRGMAAERRLPVMLGAYCGLRRGEAQGLQRRDFDRAEGMLSIARSVTHGAVSTPKTDSSVREVAAPPWLAAELAAYLDARRVVALDGSDWLFPGKGGRPQFNNFERWWRGMRERFVAQLADRARAEKLRREFTHHCLRHTYLTMMAEAGVNVAVAQAQAGHASSTMTRHYTHPSRSAKRASAALLPAPNRCATAASGGVE